MVVVMCRGYEEVARMESAHDGRSVLKSFFASKIFCIINNDIWQRLGQADADAGLSAARGGWPGQESRGDMIILVNILRQFHWVFGVASQTTC